MANEAKHAHASNVTIRVGAVSGLLRVGIRDDGAGGARQSEQAAGTSLSNELPLTNDAGAPH